MNRYQLRKRGNLQNRTLVNIWAGQPRRSELGIYQSIINLLDILSGTSRFHVFVIHEDDRQTFWEMEKILERDFSVEQLEYLQILAIEILSWKHSFPILHSPISTITSYSQLEDALLDILQDLPRHNGSHLHPPYLFFHSTLSSLLYRQNEELLYNLQKFKQLICLEMNWMQQSYQSFFQRWLEGRREYLQNLQSKCRNTYISMVLEKYQFEKQKEAMQRINYEEQGNVSEQISFYRSHNPQENYFQINQIDQLKQLDREIAQNEDEEDSMNSSMRDIIRQAQSIEQQEEELKSRSDERALVFEHLTVEYSE